MDQTQVKNAAGAVEQLVEGSTGLTAFHPLIKWISDFAIERFVATGEPPTEADILASVPDAYQHLVAGWDAYVPSGDGTL